MAKQTWLKEALKQTQLELAKKLTARQLNDYRKRMVVPQAVAELHQQIIIFKQELGGIQ
jgi:hypothetical protein